MAANSDVKVWQFPTVVMVRWNEFSQSYWVMNKEFTVHFKFCVDDVPLSWIEKMNGREVAYFRAVTTWPGNKGIRIEDEVTRREYLQAA